MPGRPKFGGLVWRDPARLPIFFGTGLRAELQGAEWRQQGFSADQWNLLGSCNIKRLLAPSSTDSTLYLLLVQCVSTSSANTFTRLDDIYILMYLPTHQDVCTPKEKKRQVLSRIPEYSQNQEVPNMLSVTHFLHFSGFSFSFSTSSNSLSAFPQDQLSFFIPCVNRLQL